MRFLSAFLLVVLLFAASAPSQPAPADWQLPLGDYEINQPNIVQRRRELSLIASVRRPPPLPPTQKSFSQLTLDESFFEDEIWASEVEWSKWGEEQRKKETEWQLRKKSFGSLELRDQQYFGELRELAKKHAVMGSNQRPALHLTFVAGNYAYLGLNWMTSLKRLGITNFLLVSLDPLAAQILEGKNIVHFPGNPKLFKGVSLERFSSIWQIRWVHAIAILQAGIDVILSDSDLVWLKPPPPLGEFDIWGSPGTFPRDFFDKWNFTVCNGLIFLRSNQRVVSFLELVLDDIQATGDDQVSFNHELERSGLIQINTEAPAFAASHFYTQAPFLRFVAGHPGYFARTCEKTDQMITIHCPASKDAEGKIKVFVKHSLWLLDENLNDPMA